MASKISFRRWPVRLTIAILILGATGPTAHAEMIHEFTSDIQVHSDGHLIVTDTIIVTASHYRIKRGIYRDFSTRYKTPAGKTKRVMFKVLEVLRNGNPEPYHIERTREGKRIYIGTKGRFVERGRHTYTITYSTNAQIGFFADYDELYWNVTGGDWEFMIEQATVTVSLPHGTQILSSEGYTGRFGEQGQDYWLAPVEDSQITLGTARPLLPGEGFTIAISWPKGIVLPAGLGTRLSALLEEFSGISLALVGIMLLLAYYGWAWTRVGRDLAPGTTIPLFEPPEGLSPAAIRFLSRMKFDHTAFTAAILSLAVKGMLTIEEEKGQFSLKKQDPMPYPALTWGEKRILKELFQFYRTVIPLNKDQYLPIGSAIDGLEEELKQEFEVFYFMRNRNYLIPGLLISVCTLVALLAFSPDFLKNIFLSLWAAGWVGSFYNLGLHCWRSWRGVQRQRQRTFFTALGKSLGLLVLTATGITSLIFLARSFTPAGVLIVLVVTGVNLLFYFLLKAPTAEGRQLMDEIEGFKLYLSVAEKERLLMYNPPHRTPELFERLLPYALALGVAHKWSAQFESVMTQAAEQNNYQPLWYHGESFGLHNFAAFTTAVGSSLGSAISASSIDPGSASGSLGGGFAGGGGGGGGGGGW